MDRWGKLETVPGPPVSCTIQNLTGLGLASPNSSTYPRRFVKAVKVADSRWGKISIFSRRFRVDFYFLLDSSDSTGDDFEKMMLYPDSETQAVVQALVLDRNEVP